jgi:hypothetical protein
MYWLIDAGSVRAFQISSFGASMVADTFATWSCCGIAVLSS